MGGPREGEKASGPPEKIFEFSSEFNVIHLVLDGFESDVFFDLLSENPDSYSKSLPDSPSSRMPWAPFHDLHVGPRLFERAGLQERSAHAPVCP